MAGNQILRKNQPFHGLIHSAAIPVFLDFSHRQFASLANHNRPLQTNQLHHLTYGIKQKAALTDNPNRVVWSERHVLHTVFFKVSYFEQFIKQVEVWVKFMCEFYFCSGGSAEQNGTAVEGSDR